MGSVAVAEPLQVLLVEDNSDDALLFSGTFGGQGPGAFAVTHVPSLQEAVRAIGERPPDIILLDLGLPDSDGLDTLARMLEVTHSIPIAIMTGRDDDDAALMAVRAGAQDYLVKGYADSRTVSRVLRYAIERHRLVNELEEARRREAFRATHDALTGLANRSLFFDRLGHALARVGRYAESFAVAFLDVNDFKTINDRHGHDGGDRVLRVLAERLRRTTRASDTVARVGGDEFAIVIERVQRADADQLVAAMMERIQEPIVVETTTLSPTLSYGVAHHPEDGQDARELLKAADDAMYRMKRRVGSRVGGATSPPSERPSCN